MTARRTFALPGGVLLLGLAIAVALTVAVIAPDVYAPFHRIATVSASDPVVANVLAALIARRVDLVGQMQAILDKAEAEDRDLTAEETTAYDAHKAEKTGLDSRIARLQELAASTAGLEAVVPGVARNQGVITPPGPHAAREFENFAEFMHAVRFRPGDQRLVYDENAGAAGAEGEGGEMRAELRMDNDTQGGFLVPPQLRPGIMRIDAQASLIRPRAQVIPAGSPPDASVTLVALDQDGANPANMFGGVEVKWIGEGDEKPETDARFKTFTLEPQEVAGLVTVTDKLLRNWQASGAYVEGLLRGAVDQAEDYAFLRGTGVGQPLGALNSPAMFYVNRAQANRIAYLDLVGMVARMLMRGGSPIWSASQSVLPQIMTLQDPSGRYIWVPDAKEGFAGTLLGYPLRWNNRQPGLGSKGDIVLCDWSHYVIKDGSGPFVAASAHVKFTSNKTVIKIFWNVDGAPDMKGVIKEENGYEVAPFVGLDVPA